MYDLSRFRFAGFSLPVTPFACSGLSRFFAVVARLRASVRSSVTVFALLALTSRRLTLSPSESLALVLSAPIGFLIQGSRTKRYPGSSCVLVCSRGPYTLRVLASSTRFRFSRSFGPQTTPNCLYFASGSRTPYSPFFVHRRVPFALSPGCLRVFSGAGGTWIAVCPTFRRL